MLLLVGSVALMTFVIVISYTAHEARAMATEDALDRAHEIAARYTNLIKGEVEVATSTARTTADCLAGYLGDADPPSRQTLASVLAQVLASNPDYLSVWCITEPNAVDGFDAHYATTEGHDASGRFIPRWTRQGTNLLRQTVEGHDDPGELGGFYHLMKAHGNDLILEPHRREVEGMSLHLTTVATPIILNDRFIGMIGIDLNLEPFVRATEVVKDEGSLWSTGYFSVVSNEGRYVAHPKRERLGNPVVESDPWSEPFLPQIRRGDPFVTDSMSRTTGKFSKRLSTPLVIGNTATPWAVWVTIPMDQVLARADIVTMNSVLIGIAAMVLMVLVVFWIARGKTPQRSSRARFDASRKETNWSRKRLLASTKSRPIPDRWRSSLPKSPPLRESRARAFNKSTSRCKKQVNSSSRKRTAAKKRLLPATICARKPLNSNPTPSASERWFTGPIDSRRRPFTPPHANAVRRKIDHRQRISLPPRGTPLVCVFPVNLRRIRPSFSTRHDPFRNDVAHLDRLHRFG